MWEEWLCRLSCMHSPHPLPWAAYLTACSPRHPGHGQKRDVSTPGLQESPVQTWLQNPETWFKGTNDTERLEQVGQCEKRGVGRSFLQPLGIKRFAGEREWEKPRWFHLQMPLIYHHPALYQAQSMILTHWKLLLKKSIVSLFKIWFAIKPRSIRTILAKEMSSLLLLLHSGRFQSSAHAWRVLMPVLPNADAKTLSTGFPSPSRITPLLGARPCTRMLQGKPLDVWAKKGFCWYEVGMHIAALSTHGEKRS